jgi:hypothetical protein
VEESALVLAALLDARSSGADALQANDAPLFAHAVAMAPPKRRGENAATKAALAYASQLLELTSRNPADSQGEAKEDSVSSLQSKAQDKERRGSTEDPAHHLSNILVHTTIDKRPHDISIVTNHTEDSVQVVCIDNFGVVSRLRLCLSDVQDFSPSVFDLSQIEHANELVRWLDYRSIPTGLASARVKSLVYVPIFEPIPGSRPASLSLPKRLNGWSPKSIELLGSENASDSAIAVAFNSPKDRVSPIRDLEIELNLPAPYTECARSVTKIQAVARGHQAKRKVEFKKKVRELKIARRKEKNEAIQMGVL